MEKEWNEIQVKGRRDFIFKEKLRILKERLKWWNKVVFGKIDLDMEDNERAIKFGDERLEDDIVGNHTDILLNRKEVTSKLLVKF